MTKHYHAVNAGRGLIGGVLFSIFELSAGTAYGVYAATDAKEIEALDKLVADPRSAVTVISQAEYDAALKKKSQVNSFTNSLNTKQRLESYPPLKGQRAAVVVSDPIATDAPLEIKQTVETVEEALKVGPVGDPAPAPPPVVEVAPEPAKPAPKAKSAKSKD